MIKQYGIASIGLHLPPLAMKVETLAALRGVDPEKYKQGLGCSTMALCPENYGVVDLATEAAKRALSRFDGHLDDIGMICMGTETAMDMSRPISAWVAERLGLKGAVRSYEVKHACYGGTLALRQALEWKLSGVSQGKAALVIAADVALYAENDPGEPTQGAGAVAMIIDEPLIAKIDPLSFPWSEPAFDFWRPEGESYPHVDGAFSLECYKHAATECFRAMINHDGRDSFSVLSEFRALCFHVPFPKMVKKAFVAACQSVGWDEPDILRFYDEKIQPTMTWNTLSGNAYTASLWICVANVLKELAEGERMTAFSYGSGFGAELLTLTAGPKALRADWTVDIEKDLSTRILLDEAQYLALRQKKS
jgi:hydroxymethylglutaryl-CoA synthase